MNFDSLLAPIDGDQPSGVELRHDLRFHDLERLTEPASREHRVNEDGTLGDAEPAVDWERIIADGTELASDGRDLRLFVLMSRACYNIDGFPALAEALGFLAETIGQYWDSLHPAKRDRDDPQVAALPRLNALRQLENDDNGLLGDLRFGVVLNPRGIGPITGDDLAVTALNDYEMLNRAASGLSQIEKDALIAGHGRRVNRVSAASRAMAAEEPEAMNTLVGGIRACEDQIAALGAAVATQGGFVGQPGLNMTELSEFLAACRKTLEAAMGEDETDEPTLDEHPSAHSPADNATATVHAAPAPGTINSRSDVEGALDRIIAFYERTEPGSPMPHLARRMRRMVAMDFLELMEEIAPSGLKEFRNVAGVDDAKKK